MDPYRDALYQVPDHTSTGDLPAPDVGRGDPIPLAQRLRRAFGGDPVGAHTPVTVSTSTVRLSVPAGALSAILQVQTAPVRYTVDGSTPTASSGARADPGTVLEVTGWQTMVAVQFVREGAADATVVPMFYM